MTADRLNELIEKYLDGVVEPEELSELETTLVQDPQAATAFAERARLDGMLHAHFNVLEAESLLEKQVAAAQGSTYAFDAPIDSYGVRSQKLMKRLINHLWGPTGSILFHAALVIILIKFLVFDPNNKRAEVEVRLMEVETLEQEELEQILQKLDNLDSPMHQTDMPAVPAENVPDPTEFDAPDPIDDFAALDVLSDVQGPLILKGLLAGRSELGRARGLREHAGRHGRLTEPAVIKALEWLRIHQEPNGSWVGADAANQQQRVAVTGLGLLAFLSHGETISSERYGPTVDKAVQWLLQQQEHHATGRRGAFCVINSHGAYAQGIAAYAISESFAMMRIPRLEESMNDAIAVIVQGQQPNGAWTYSFRGGRTDSSVMSWQLQALKAAYMAGSDVEGLYESMQKGAQRYREMYAPGNSMFRYSSDVGNRGTATISSMAGLCLQLVGYAKSDEVLGSMSALDNEDCSWSVASPHHWSMYYWYYLTQMKFHHGGRTWRSWNDKFAREYVSNQNADGSWSSPFQPAASVQGHGRGESAIGPAFTTALGALTLQVYYRHLPTYQQIEVKEEIAPIGESGEIGIRI